MSKTPGELKQEGREAAKANKPSEENPYELLSDEYIAWSDGWSEQMKQCHCRWHEEGRKAEDAGEGYDSNPYKNGTKESVHWACGHYENMKLRLWDDKRTIHVRLTLSVQAADHDEAKRLATETFNTYVHKIWNQRRQPDATASTNKQEAGRFKFAFAIGWKMQAKGRSWREGKQKLDADMARFVALIDKDCGEVVRVERWSCSGNDAKGKTVLFNEELTGLGVTHRN
jgi:hypothetical protein